MPDESALPPGIAAAELGVSAQSLRRYASWYADVFGELPTEGGRRVFPAEAIRRLKAAQALMKSGRASGIRAALDLINQGQFDLQRLQIPAAPGLSEVMAELRSLRSEVERLSDSMQALGTARRSAPDTDADRLPAIERRMSADLDRVVEALVEFSDRQSRGHEALQSQVGRLQTEVALRRDVERLVDQLELWRKQTRESTERNRVGRPKWRFW